MVKLHPVAALALVANAVAFSATPAFAETTITGTVPTQSDLDAACMNAIAGHPNSANFSATADTSSVVTVSTSTSQSQPTVTSTGETSYGGETYFGPYLNPGLGSGDSNIFAANMYTTQTLATVTTSYTLTTVAVKQTNFHCRVLNKQGNLAGSEWQGINLSTATWTETTTTVVTSTQQGGTSPLATPVLKEMVLVCNKPNGVWKTKDTYHGEFGMPCGDDLYAASTVWTDAGF